MICKETILKTKITSFKRFSQKIILQGIFKGSSEMRFLLKRSVCSSTESHTDLSNAILKIMDRKCRTKYSTERKIEASLLWHCESLFYKCELQSHSFNCQRCSIKV